MRKIGGEYQRLGANGLGNIRHGPLLKLKRDETLAAKINARSLFQMRYFEPIVLGVLVHPLQPIGNPTTARLHKADAQAGMTLQNSAEDQTRRRGHLFHGMRVQVEKTVAVKPFRAGGRQTNTGADMDQRRNIELLGQAPKGVIGRMIEISVVHRVRRNK